MPPGQLLLERRASNGLSGVWQRQDKISFGFGGMWRSLVSAPALGAGGRGFESRHPDLVRSSQGAIGSRRCPAVSLSVQSVDCRGHDTEQPAARQRLSDRGMISQPPHPPDRHPRRRGDAGLPGQPHPRRPLPVLLEPRPRRQPARTLARAAACMKATCSSARTGESVTCGRCRLSPDPASPWRRLQRCACARRS